MNRRRWLLLAAPLCVVVVAASVAFAATPDIEHASNAKIDDLHAERPIAALDRTPGLFRTLLEPSRIEVALKDAATEAFVRQAATTQFLEAAATTDFLVAAAAAEEAAAAAAGSRSYAPSSGGGGGGDALACIRAHESDSAGGYGAVSSGGTYRGAYQFLQGTWDSTAAGSGRPDLVGVDPASASPADQDALASSLYSQAGSQPWGGRC